MHLHLKNKPTGKKKEEIRQETSFYTWWLETKKPTDLS